MPHVPAFLLVGVTLLVGSVPGLVRARAFTRDVRVLALGVYGLFGYHFCLFMALRLAPPVEANLVNYLWPVLIVAMSPPLRWFHVAGALTAFAGAALIATGGDFTHLTWQPGLLLALAAAIIWSSYSVLTRRLRGLSSAVVSQFCLVSGVLAVATHELVEPHVSLTGREIAVLVALGVGPMGAASTRGMRRSSAAIRAASVRSHTSRRCSRPPCSCSSAAAVHRHRRDRDGC